MPAVRARAVVDLLLAAGLLAFAAATIFYVIPVEVQQPRTRFGTAAGALSPAALPTAVCVLIGIGAAAYLVRTIAELRLFGDAATDEGSLAVSWRLIATVILTATYIASLQRFSFAITTPVFLLGSYVALSDQPLRWRWAELLLAALGFAAFSLLIQTIFERGFKVYLGP